MPTVWIFQAGHADQVIPQFLRSISVDAVSPDWSVAMMVTNFVAEDAKAHPGRPLYGLRLYGI
jgi:hypothetical protein